MEIVRALDDLHRGFPKLHFERLIPCTCERCRQHREPHFFALDILLERLAYRKETIECRYPPYAAVPIEGLLSEIGPWLYRLDPSGATFTIYGDYIGGDRVEGDRIDVGDISDARGIAVGRQAAATVKRKR